MKVAKELRVLIIDFNYLCLLWEIRLFISTCISLKKRRNQNKYDDNINQSLIPSVFDKIHLVTRDKVQIDKTVNPSDLRNTST